MRRKKPLLGDSKEDIEEQEDKLVYYGLMSKLCFSAYTTYAVPTTKSSVLGIQNYYSILDIYIIIILW